MAVALHGAYIMQWGRLAFSLSAAPGIVSLREGRLFHNVGPCTESG